LGDLIEIQGINEVFKSSHTPDAPLVVGASKTCVGHTELIAGLIGVLKTIGSLNNGKVPGLVQLTENNMNPSLDCSVVPLLLPHENVTLKQSPNRPLRALVLYVLFILLFYLEELNYPGQMALQAPLLVQFSKHHPTTRETRPPRSSFPRTPP